MFKPMPSAAERAEHDRIDNEQIARIDAAMKLLDTNKMFAKLSEREQGLVFSCRIARVISPAQEKWLLDIADRHSHKTADEQGADAPLVRDEEQRGLPQP